MKKISLLSEGDEAPVFSYRTAEGEERDTASLKGGYYLVFFYPKDNTPGCTKEACGFRDNYESLHAAGVEVIGVSVDSEASHAKFREKRNLPFPLAADTEKKIVNDFGVFGERKFMGRTYEGTHRVSYLVGPEGRVVKVYPKVKPADHPVQVLSDIKSLTAKP